MADVEYAYTRNGRSRCGRSSIYCGLKHIILGILFVGLFVAVICLAIAVAVLTTRQDKGPKCPAYLYQNCVSCEHLQSALGPDAKDQDDYSRLVYTKMVAQQAGANLCCMDQGRLLDPGRLLIEHFEKELKKRSEERDMEREQCGPPTIVNIPDTVEFYTDSTMNSFQTISEYRVMETDEFLNRTTIDDHGHVVVQIPGMYEIGARVSFLRPACHRSPKTRFETRLVRENRHYDYRNEPFVLQEDVQTKECKEEKCWMRHVSMINGTFSLVWGDEIYINVTRRDLLELGGHTFLAIKFVKRDPKVTLD